MAFLHIPIRSGARAPQRIQGINWASPLARGLVAAWFPVTGSFLGDISRLSGDHDTGNSILPTYLSNGLLGVQRTSLGNDDISAVGAPWDTPSITIAAWLQTPTVSAIQEICAREAASGYRIFQFRLIANGAPQFISGIALQPTPRDFRTATTQVDDGHPHLVVATFEDSVRTAISVDGVVESETSIGGPLGQSSSNPLALLFQNNSNGHFWDTGHVGAILMWNRGFADAEIAALYNPRTRWEIIDQGYRYISLPAAAGGSITGTILSQATAAGLLPGVVQRKATVLAQAVASGVLDGDVNLSGAFIGQSRTEGNLYADVQISSALAGQSAGGEGLLDGEVQISAALSGQSVAAGALTGTIVMPSWTLSGIDSTHHVIDGPRINAAILDYGDAIDASDIAEAGRMGDAGASNYMNAFTTHGVLAATAKIYIEYEIISTANIAQQACGVGNSSYSKASTSQFGDTANMVACRATGHVRINNATEQDHSGAVPYAVNDQWGMAFDANTGKIWFRYKGAWLNGGDPAAGTGEDYTLTGSDFEVACTVNGNGEVRWNFGQRTWANTIPVGFTGLGDFP
jgi:hypothetical protein